MDKPEYLRSLGIRCLRWVLYAKRPLYTKELQFALATFDKGQNARDFELDELSVIFGACANLVVQQETGSEFSVRPAHYSVQEYFTGGRQPLDASVFQPPLGDEVEANGILSADCLAHIYQPMMHSGELRSTDYLGCHLVQDAFLNYAACHFGTHLLATEPDAARLHIERFLTSTPGLFRSVLTLRAIPNYEWRQAWGGQISIGWITNRDFDCPYTFTASSVVAATELRLFPNIPRDYVCQEGKDIALLYAFLDQQLPLIIALLASGADVECRDPSGCTPLCLAVLNSNKDAALLCLDNGASARVQDYEGNSVLQMAVMRMDCDFVRLLLERGADVSYLGGYYGTALQAAVPWVLEQNFGVYQLLVDWGADLNARGGYHSTALMAAAFSNRVATTRFLVTAGADIHAVEDGIGSALHVAARHGSTTVVEYLLDNGADIDLTGDTFSSPLIAAMEWTETHEAFRCLLSRGARVDVRALVVAAKTHRVHALMQILERRDAGPKYNAIDIGVALVAVWEGTLFGTDMKRREAEAVIRILKRRLSPSGDGMGLAVSTRSTFESESDWDSNWDSDSGSDSGSNSGSNSDSHRDEHSSVGRRDNAPGQRLVVRKHGTRRKYVWFATRRRKHTVEITILHEHDRHPRVGGDRWRRTRSG
jgi:ankyrin repeat protein